MFGGGGGGVVTKEGGIPPPALRASFPKALGEEKHKLRGVVVVTAIW
ncbi:MAG: hypothetical protein JNJ78_09540 [Anaerolineae bacterium]|nr:hypothetical protein [Anaerolineae bacterium]